MQVAVLYVYIIYAVFSLCSTTDALAMVEMTVNMSTYNVTEDGFMLIKSYDYPKEPAQGTKTGVVLGVPSGVGIDIVPIVLKIGDTSLKDAFKYDLRDQVANKLHIGREVYSNAYWPDGNSRPSLFKSEPQSNGYNLVIEYEAEEGSGPTYGIVLLVLAKHGQVPILREVEMNSTGPAYNIGKNDMLLITAIPRTGLNASISLKVARETLVKVYGVKCKGDICGQIPKFLFFGGEKVLFNYTSGESDPFILLSTQQSSMTNYSLSIEYPDSTGSAGPQERLTLVVITQAVSTGAKNTTADNPELPGDDRPNIPKRSTVKVKVMIGILTFGILMFIRVVVALVIRMWRSYQSPNNNIEQRIKQIIYQHRDADNCTTNV